LTTLEKFDENQYKIEISVLRCLFRIYYFAKNLVKDNIDGDEDKDEENIKPEQTN
jgi:hypothetical protein